VGVSGPRALAACGDDRYIFVESQPGSLFEADPSRWRAEGQITEFATPGTFVYGHTIALRFGIESVVNHDVTQIETASATITPIVTFARNPCVASEATCAGTTCEAEIGVLAQGNCLIRIRALTPDGERRAACWRHAQYELEDPFNSPEIAVNEARDAEELQSCLDSL